MKVAYYSPMPPERSGIADYSAHLLPALRERIERRGRQARPHPARPRHRRRAYHVGNNPDAHGWIVDALRKRPGVVVLHDFVLHHLIAGLTIGRRDGRGYLDAMEREGGIVGRLLGHGVLDKRIQLLWESRRRTITWPARCSTSPRAHRPLALRRAAGARAGYEGPVWRIPHLAWEHAPIAPRRSRGRR